MTKKNCTLPTPNVQAKMTGKISKEEKELANWFFDKEWDESNECGNFRNYHNYMGWVFCKGIISADMSVLDLAFMALGTIKENAPEAYQNFMSKCKMDLDKLESAAVTDNIVDFQPAGGVG